MEWLIVLLAAAIAWFFLASMTREENEREARRANGQSDSERETIRYQPVRARNVDNMQTTEELAMTHNDNLSMHTPQTDHQLNENAQIGDLPLADVNDESNSAWDAYSEEQNRRSPQQYDDNVNEQIMNQVGPAPQSIDSRWDDFPRDENRDRHNLDRRSDDSIHFDKPEKINEISETLLDAPYGLEISGLPYGQLDQAMSFSDYNPTEYLSYSTGGVPVFSPFFQMDTLAISQVNTEDIPYLTAPLRQAHASDPYTGESMPTGGIPIKDEDEDDNDPPPTWSPS